MLSGRRGSPGTVGGRAHHGVAGVRAARRVVPGGARRHGAHGRRHRVGRRAAPVGHGRRRRSRRCGVSWRCPRRPWRWRRHEGGRHDAVVGDAAGGGGHGHGLRLGHLFPKLPFLLFCFFLSACSFPSSLPCLSAAALLSIRLSCVFLPALPPAISALFRRHSSPSLLAALSAGEDSNSGRENGVDFLKMNPESGGGRFREACIVLSDCRCLDSCFESPLISIAMYDNILFNKTNKIQYNLHAFS